VVPPLSVEGELVAAPKEEPQTVEGKLLQMPELELMDKHALFDLHWFNDADDKARE
jgi:hypothetical protein